MSTMRHAAVDQIDRATFWGITDRGTWLNHFPVAGRTNHPLLFDVVTDPARALQTLPELDAEERMRTQ